MKRETSVGIRSPDWHVLASSWHPLERQGFAGCFNVSYVAHAHSTGQFVRLSAEGCPRGLDEAACNRFPILGIFVWLGDPNIVITDLRLVSARRCLLQLTSTSQATGTLQTLAWTLMPL